MNLWRALWNEPHVEACGLAGAHLDVDDEGLKSRLLDAHAMRSFREWNHQPIRRCGPFQGSPSTRTVASAGCTRNASVPLRDAS